MWKWKKDLLEYLVEHGANINKEKNNLETPFLRYVKVEIKI